MAITKTRHFHTLMLLFFMSIFVVSCSVSDTETDTFSDVKSTTYANYNFVDTTLKVDTTPVNINDLESSSRSANGNSKQSIWSTRLTETLYYDTVTDNDWRDNPLLKSSASYKDLARWIFLKANKINVHYTNQNGGKFFLNFTFFTHRKDVWYQVVSEDRGILQTGWSTVQLVGQSLQHYSPSYPSSPTTGWFIKFDVRFHPETLLNEKSIFTVFYNNTLAQNEHRGQLTTTIPAPYSFQLDNKKSLTHPGNFGYRNGHVVGKTFMPVAAEVDGSVDFDWRHGLAEFNIDNVFADFLYRQSDYTYTHQTTKRFNYMRTIKGRQYWMNLTFYPKEGYLDYSVVSQEYGTIQRGRSGYNLEQRQMNGRPTLFIDLDVTFDKSTEIPHHWEKITLIMFRYGGQMRGLVRKYGSRHEFDKKGDFAYETKVYVDNLQKPGIYREDITHEWRDYAYKHFTKDKVISKSIADFIFMGSDFKKAHVYTTSTHGKIWLSVKFSTNTNLVEYYISSEKYGKQQYGMTGAHIKQDEDKEIVFFTLDTDFLPVTGIEGYTTFAIFRSGSSYRGAMKKTDDFSTVNIGNGKFQYLSGGYK